MARLIKGERLCYGEPQRVVPQSRDLPAEKALQKSTMLPTAPLEAIDPEEVGRQRQSQAEDIIEQARQEAQAIARQAERDGFEAGRQAGWQAAQREAGRLLEEAAAVLEQGRRERDRILQALDGEIVELALAVARKILRQEIARDQEAVLRMAKEALGRLRDEEAVSLRANPMDLITLETGRDELTEFAPWLSKVDLVEDLSVEPGGLVVESSHGRLDGRLNSQLGKVEEALRGAIHSGNWSLGVGDARGERDWKAEPVASNGHG